MDRLTPKRKLEKQKRIDDIINMYKEVDDLEKADIFHVYPTNEYGFIDSKGYYDSQLFSIVAFNSITFQMKRYECKSDAIKFFNDAKVKLTQIFIDGAFLIKMTQPEIFNVWQVISIGQI